MLYVSKTHQNPNGGNETDFFCGIYGVDVCVLPSEEITLNQKFYIGIFCQDSCSFSLKAKYEKKIKLTFTDFAYMYFDDNSTEEISIFIPDDASTAGINRLQIEVFLLNPEEVDEPFEMYVKIGDTAPSTLNYDFQAEPLWHDGKGVLISG